MRMVRVTWIDAALHAEWTDTHEEANLVPVDSVGFLVSKDTRVIKLAQSICANTRYSAIQSIPRLAVVSINPLSTNRQTRKQRKR